MFKVFLIGLLVAVFAAFHGYFTFHQYLYGMSEREFSKIPSRAGIVDGRYESEIREARRFIKRYMKVLEVPSVSVAIAVEDKVVWSEAFGYADLERRIQAGPDQPYRIFSISKTFTGVLLAKFVKEGKLDLDVPIQTYVPSFPEKEHPVTLRHLAGHLGGIRNYHDEKELLNTRRFRALEEALDLFKDDPLKHPPGTRYLYTSLGYDLIGAAVESVTGERYPETLRRLVLKPAGIKNIGTEDDFPPSSVRYYERNKDGKPEPIPKIDFSHKYASGGLVGTPESVALFGNAMLYDRIVDAETKAWMWTPLKTNDGKPVPYGIGWELPAPLPRALRYFWDAWESAGWYFPAAAGFYGTVSHRGGSLGGISLLRIFPKHKIVFAMAANVNGDLPAIKQRFEYTSLVTEPFLKKTSEEKKQK